jgi:DNA-directed RNA polymerase subunit RPC12/RpoP
MVRESGSQVSTCPYCGKHLRDIPKRKKKCPHCGEFIYVRTLPKTRERLLVTSTQAEQIDAEWAAISRRKRYVDMLWHYQITEADFEERKRQKSKAGIAVSDQDVIWSFLNELILEYGNKLDLQELSHLYYSLALILDEGGREFADALKESRKMELLDFKRIGIKKVRILTAGEHACQACQKLSGKVITVEDALKDMPLPCEECSFSLYSDNPGFCRCSYVSEIDLDDYLE